MLAFLYCAGAWFRCLEGNCWTHSHAKSASKTIRPNQEHVEGLYLDGIQKHPPTKNTWSLGVIDVYRLDEIHFSAHAFAHVGDMLLMKTMFEKKLRKKKGSLAQRQQTYVPFDVRIDLHLVGYRLVWRYRQKWLLLNYADLKELWLHVSVLW